MHRAKTPNDPAAAALRQQSKVVAHDALQVHGWVKSVLEGSLAAKHAYAFKPRTKPFNEIFAKVQAKRNHEDPEQRKPTYRPDDLTDISGFRIVSLFNAEIPIALSHLLDLLETPVADARGTFMADPVIEIILFSNRREGDPLSIDLEVKKVVSEHGLEKKLKPVSSTYSSVHVVVRSRYAVPGEAPLIAASEIQLRSVFDEAWGEINHRLRYGPAKRARARGGSAALAVSDESTLLQHLDALKSLTDGCAQYADLISLDLAARRLSRETRLPQPTDSADEIVKSFRTSSAAIYHLVKLAFELRAEATAAARDASENPDLGSAKHKTLFRDAGRTFAEALERIATDKSVAEDDRKKYESVLQREVAYCYQFSGNEELRTRAEAIYEALIETDPNNIDALARLALIKRDAQDLSEARTLMEAALDEDVQQNPDQHPSQLRWLLCRNLAVLYWQIFEDDRNAPDAPDLLAAAVELSEQARNAAPTDPQRAGASLNLLYYLAVQHARTGADAKAEIVRRAEAVLPVVREDDVPLERWDTAKLDTLLHVEATFGTKSAAKKVAALIAERLKPALKADPRATPLEGLRALSEEEQDFYLFAMEVLAGD